MTAINDIETWYQLSMEIIYFGLLVVQIKKTIDSKI